MDGFVEGHIYKGTIPSSRKSPREYVVVRVAENTLTLRYGWFGYEGSRGPKKHGTPDDPWTWSPKGVERFSKWDFESIEDLGPPPEAGQPRKEFPWAMEML